MKNIIFVGFLDEYSSMQLYNKISIAGNKYQLGFLRALKAHKDVNLRVVSITPMPRFPSGPFIKRKVKKNIEKIEVTQISFVNFSFLKEITIRRKLLKELQNLLATDEFEYIITFNYDYLISKPIEKISKCHKYLKIVPILADLPIYHQKFKISLKTFLILIRNKLNLKKIRQLNHAIILNHNTAHDFLSENNYVIIEGGYEPQSNSYKLLDDTFDCKNIVYTGTLDNYSGVDMLVKSFHKLTFSDNSFDYNLDIYGHGEFADLVKSYANINSKIHYHGSVDQVKIQKIQKHASFLINPKNPNHPVSNYTFPSKMFEYIGSKRPVLTTNINGHEREYSPITITINNFSEYGFIDTFKMINLLSEKHLKSIAIKAFNYINQNKTWINQINSLIIYLNTLDIKKD